jgi:hypothetical protein
VTSFRAGVIIAVILVAFGLCAALMMIYGSGA